MLPDWIRTLALTRHSQRQQSAANSPRRGLSSKAVPPCSARACGQCGASGYEPNVCDWHRLMHGQCARFWRFRQIVPSRWRSSSAASAKGPLRRRRTTDLVSWWKTSIGAWLFSERSCEERMAWPVESWAGGWRPPLPPVAGPGPRRPCPRTLGLASPGGGEVAS